MSVIKKMRRQFAIYWERLDPDIFGRYSFAVPVEVPCRWDDASAEFRNSQGASQMSRAEVYPDRVMKVGDMLRKGSLETDTPLDPRELTDTYEIQGFDQIPNFKATETLYIAHL